MNNYEKFGELLRNTRISCNISLRQLARLVNKTPTYISDIEHGNNRPPDKVLMNKIISALNIDSQQVCYELYDTAAYERGEVPADIVEFIMSSKDVRNIIRDLKHKQISKGGLYND